MVVNSLSTALNIDIQKVSNFIYTMFIKCKVNKLLLNYHSKTVKKHYKKSWAEVNKFRPGEWRPGCRWLRCGLINPIFYSF